VHKEGGRCVAVSDMRKADWATPAAAWPNTSLMAEPGSEHHTERESFARLVPPVAPALVRAAAALVGAGDAEDAAQEAVLRAWQAWPTLRDHSAVRPWLLTILVNVCRQWRRGGFGRRLRLTDPLPDGESELLARIESDPGASDHAGALDLRDAVNRLAVDLRLVVLLRYYGGLDASEVGQALGIPAATARTRLRRALIQLRDRLERVSGGSAGWDPRGGD
jgi:RNA polymerase sigma-70 factor (ECF subfamily)